MEVKDLISKVFGTPTAPTVPQAGTADVFGGVRPEPQQTKNDAFNASILTQAQQTFQAPAPEAGQKENVNTTGTAGSMIPPGWSSQKK